MVDTGTDKGRGTNFKGRGQANGRLNQFTLASGQGKDSLQQLKWTSSIRQQHLALEIPLQGPPPCPFTSRTTGLAVRVAGDRFHLFGVPFHRQNGGSLLQTITAFSDDGNHLPLVQQFQAHRKASVRAKFDWFAL